MTKLIQGAPFAYAVGSAAFRHLNLLVDERVLIPRPETEVLVGEIAGVRSAPIVDTDTAKLSREHNDLNVLTLGARVLPESRAREIVKTFIQTPFDGGRHATRVSKIHSIEHH